MFQNWSLEARHIFRAAFLSESSIFLIKSMSLGFVRTCRPHPGRVVGLLFMVFQLFRKLFWKLFSKFFLNFFVNFFGNFLENFNFLNPCSFIFIITNKIIVRVFWWWRCFSVCTFLFVRFDASYCRCRQCQLPCVDDLFSVRRGSCVTVDSIVIPACSDSLPVFSSASFSLTPHRPFWNQVY